jgi:hypothetical protein
MLACSDLSAVYNTLTNYFLRCVADSKPTGGDQFAWQWDTVQTQSAQSIVTHVQYMQNGETTSSSGDYYNEGDTTCPGTGGCGALNTNRLVQSMESNTPDGTGHNPTPQFGIISGYMSPSGNATYVKWDCNSSGTPAECGPGGGTYTDPIEGPNGHTDRVSVWGGGAVGAPTTSLESLVVHKIAQSSTDTTLTTTALNVDSNWFGGQACGAVSCSVFVGARNGITPSVMTSFSTTHSGTAQYLIEGMTPGAYTVTVNEVQVSGSPFNVSAGDTTMEFESTAGTVRVTAGGVTNGSATGESGKVGVSGSVIIH